MAGLFDDILQRPQESTGGLFDDILKPPPRNPENYSDRFSSGVDSAKRGLMLTGMALSDQSPDAMADIISRGYRNAIGQTAAGREIEEGITPAAKNYKDSQGIDAVPAALGLAGRMAWEYAKRPTEALKQMLETVPASAPGIITGVMGSYGGAAAGTAVAGSVGGALGGLAGGLTAGMAGSAALELGSEFEGRVIKKMIDAKLDPSNTEAMAAVIRENYQELKDKAIAKGLTTAAVDAIANRLTLGIGGMGERTLAKQARSITERVADKSLDAGQAVSELAKVQATNAARNTMGRKLVRGAGITAGEMFGESASEGLGRIATGDEFDAVDAIREGLLAAGQGGLMAAGGKITDKVMGMPVRSDVDAEIGLANTVIGLVQGAQKPSTPLQLGNTPDPFISFPDGTVGRRADVDNYVNSLPEDQRNAARAKLMGLAPQATIADIGKAESTDDAIAAFQNSVNLTSLTGTNLAGLMGPENSIINAVREREADASDLQSLIDTETKDLQVMQANIQRDAQKQGELDALQAQGSSVAQAATVEAPTAFQLAMQRAQQKAALITPVLPTVPVPQVPVQEVAPAPIAPTAEPTYPGILPGDTARNNGQPFESENGARLKLSEVVKKGGTGEVVQIGEKAYVVRPLKESNAATPPIEEQAAPDVATPQGLPGAGNGAVQAVADAPIPAIPAAPTAVDPRLVARSKQADPEHVGRDGKLMTEGGKPYGLKQKATAKTEAKKQGMRVVRVTGGYALAPKPERTPAQIKAAQRLGLPHVGNRGVPASAHEFIVSEGMIHPQHRNEFQFGDNPKVGNRSLFASAASGGGLSLDEATEKLIEAGYLKEGASHSDAINLIGRSFTNPQYTPEGTEQVAAKEVEDQRVAYEAEQEALAQLQEAEDTAYDLAVESFELAMLDVPKGVAQSDMSMEDALLAAGYTQEEIENERPDSDASAEADESPVEAPAGSGTQDDKRRDSPTGEDQSAGSESKLALPPPADKPAPSPEGVSVSATGNANTAPNLPGIYKLSNGSFARFQDGIWWRSMPSPKEALKTEFASTGSMAPKDRMPDQNWEPHSGFTLDEYGATKSLKPFSKAEMAALQQSEDASKPVDPRLVPKSQRNNAPESESAQDSSAKNQTDALKLPDAQDSQQSTQDKALIELRKRMSVLNSLRKCLG